MPEHIQTGLHYEVCGEGIPLVCFHGFGVDLHCIKDVLEPFFHTRLSWLQRIYFDMPGMGKSPKGSVVTSDQMVEVIEGFLEDVLDGKQYFLMGFSYGGYLIRHWLKTQAHRILGAHFLCPVIHPAQRDRELPIFEVYSSDPEFMESLSDEDREICREDLAVQNRDTWSLYVKAILKGMETGDKGFLKTFQRNHYCLSRNPDTYPQGVQVPVMVFLGKQDYVVGYKDALKLFSQYPKATIHLLNGASHCAHIDQIDVYLCNLFSWFSTFLKDGIHI